MMKFKPGDIILFESVFYPSVIRYVVSVETPNQKTNKPGYYGLVPTYLASETEVAFIKSNTIDMSYELYSSAFS